MKPSDSTKNRQKVANKVDNYLSQRELKLGISEKKKISSELSPDQKLNFLMNYEVTPPVIDTKKSKATIDTQKLMETFRLNQPSFDDLTSQIKDLTDKDRVRDSEFLEMKSENQKLKADFLEMKNEFQALLNKSNIKTEELIPKSEIESANEEAKALYKLYENHLGVTKNQIEEVGKNFNSLTSSELAYLNQSIEVAHSLAILIENHKETGEINPVVMAPVVSRLVTILDKYNPTSEAGKTQYLTILIGVVALTASITIYDKMMTISGDEADGVLNDSIPLIEIKINELKNLALNLSLDKKNEVDEEIKKLEYSFGKKKALTITLVNTLKLKNPEARIKGALRIRDARIERNSKKSNFAHDAISPRHKIPGIEKFVAVLSISTELTEIRNSLEEIDSRTTIINEKINFLKSQND